MPLTLPNLDDRNYADLRADALARIPIHNPEWSNFNASDPGVTLLELFAFLTDNLLYRANWIPERNRIKFLQLLGISLRPAAAAKGVVSFRNEKGALETITLPAGVPVFAGRVEFRTTEALDILPVEARFFLRRRLTPGEIGAAQATYTQLYGSFADDTTDLDFYETVPFDPPANSAAIKPINLTDGTYVDNSLWLALLTRAREQTLKNTILADLGGKTLTLGFMPYLNDQEKILPPGGPRPDQAPQPLAFEVATGRVSTAGIPLYQPLETRTDGDIFQGLTSVQATLPEPASMGLFSTDPLEEGLGDFPPSLDDDDFNTRLLTWIRIRVAQADTAASSAYKLSLSWAGINAARITQRTEVAAELVGRGSGEPDQVLKLANTPVIPDTVQLTVGGAQWGRIDDLLAAPPELPQQGAGSTAGAPGSADPRVYVIDRESGELRFGDGLRGARPPAGAAVIARYSYGGGAAGNVGVGSVKVSPSLPAGLKVANQVPTWGGSEGETVDQAEQSIPAKLRNRDRAVSMQDFAEITRQTPGIDLGRVEVLPLFHPDYGAQVPGAVTLLVIPNDSSRPQAPVPDQFFLDAVCAWVDPRRLVTTEVHVTGPVYQGISVSVGIDVIAGREIAPVREAVKQAIRDFLSPIIGGQAGTGWPLDTAVEDRELWATAARVPGIAKVRGVRLWSANNAAITTLEMSGLQLPQLLAVGVSLGDPDDLTATPPVPAKKRLPVPVLPAGC